MGAYKSAIITTAGQNLIAQALAGSSAVKFTALKTSNYSYPASTNFEALTSLQGVKQSTDITSAIVVNQTTVKISARVSNVGITSAYYINTIGVYAETDGITETLIAVIPASTADLVPAYSTGAPYSFIYDINLTIQNSTSLNVTINDSGVATVADLRHFFEKTYDVYVTDTASGEIASFEDGADKIPMESVNVSMTPRQSFNGYDKPWPAGGGKNLIDINAITVGNTSNWGITVNGDTLTVEHKREYTTGVPFFAFNQPSGTYVISIGSSNITGQISLYVNGKLTKTINNNDTFTIDDADTNEIRFSALTGQPTVITKIQIEKGSTATSYAPYSNICPIIGWSSVTVTRTGVNVWDEEWEVGGIIWTNGQTITATDRIRSKNYCDILPSTTYYAKNDMSVFFYDLNKAFISYIQPSNSTFTTPNNAYYFKLIKLDTTTYNNDISINYPSSDHDYHAYNGNTYTTPLTTTVYGGTVDIANGELTVTDANIASYNGETLPGEWLSSYDKYAEGATPTTGAQVVYKLATPQTIQFSPTEIVSLYGYNNVWSDAGDVTVKYRADTTLYIDKKIAEMQALILENS